MIYAYFLPGLLLAALAIKYSQGQPLWATAAIAGIWLLFWPAIWLLVAAMVVSDVNDAWGTDE